MQQENHKSCSKALVLKKCTTEKTLALNLNNCWHTGGISTKQGNLLQPRFSVAYLTLINIPILPVCKFPGLYLEIHYFCFRRSFPPCNKYKFLHKQIHHCIKLLNHRILLTMVQKNLSNQSIGLVNSNYLPQFCWHSK